MTRSGDSASSGCRLPKSGLPAFRCVVAALSLLLLAVPGCTSRNGVVSPNAVANQVKAIELRVETSMSGIVKTSSPRVVSLISRSIREATRLVSPPTRRETWDIVVMSFDLRNGRSASYRYYFMASLTSEPGFLETPVGWFLAPNSLSSIVKSLLVFPPATVEVDPIDDGFLQKYGWTALYTISSQDLALPGSLIHHPGEYPTAVYWAYHNELCRDIALDLRPYLGKKVTARQYKVAEPLPGFAGSRRDDGRAVVIRDGDQIIGSWIYAYGFIAGSLKGHSWQEVAGTWDEWIGGLIDPNDPKEKELARLSPEELIRTYYDGVNRHDQLTVLQCQSRRALSNFLFDDLPPTNLYKQGFPAPSGSIVSARVLELRPVDTSGRSQRTKAFEVRVDLKVKENVASGNGPSTRFLNLVQETPTTGWRLDSQGTGP